MVTEAPQSNTHLLPERYPQHDLFICDVADAVLKDLIAQMEHPFYALSKKPDTCIRRYENNGNWLEVVPSVKGLATIYDKDILIYCISQIMAKLKDGEKVSQHVRINSRELLIFTNRGTAGKDYAALSEAIDRLAGTRISTNIQTGGEEQYNNFGLIDAAAIRRKNGLNGRLLWCEIKLSDWVFNAIRSNEVLTLHPDYFRLRKPLERRVYELARKHCGNQNKWSISLEKLLKKSGSQSPMKRFRQMIKGLADNNHLPDYMVTLSDDGMVTFLRREVVKKRKPLAFPSTIPPLQTWAFEKAKAVAPGFDIYALEQDWRDWISDKPRPTKGYEIAFIGFCKQRYRKQY